LGKLFTYAAGQDANVAIWIAREIREEHRQTLDWINQHTGTEIEFYGVVVEVLKIDDSRPAYNFKLVAFPNEWRKSNISSDSGTRISERGEAYRAFFQDLIDQLREEHHLTRARKAGPQNWFSFSTGFSGIAYGASFAQHGQFRAEIYIDRGDADLNKSLFDSLSQDKDAIEAEFGEPVSWERLDNKRASRIATYCDGSIDDNSETLEEIKDWAITRLLKLKEVFAPKLEALA
jgi:hypothetical protein